jgi:hypothetical protein
MDSASSPRRAHASIDGTPVVHTKQTGTSACFQASDEPLLHRPSIRSIYPTI